MKKRRLVIRTIILVLLGAAVAYTLYQNFTKDQKLQVEIGEKDPGFSIKRP